MIQNISEITLHTDDVLGLRERAFNLCCIPCVLPDPKLRSEAADGKQTKQVRYLGKDKDKHLKIPSTFQISIRNKDNDLLQEGIA